ncbi:hypothetical protein LTR27_012436 [Elasticomyces elasticus]|nr:hypothetical protein LTR27_012436 [Elasticomyces elasticus]
MALLAHAGRRLSSCTRVVVQLPSLRTEESTSTYDRTGYDHSERGPHKVLTEQQAALELQTLLRNIAIAPSYILIGNSYGGIIERAFLETMPCDAMTGLLLPETGSELLYHLYPEIPRRKQVGAGLDLAGLTHFREESQLTNDEYQNLLDTSDQSEYSRYLGAPHPFQGSLIQEPIAPRYTWYRPSPPRHDMAASCQRSLSPRAFCFSRTALSGKFLRGECFTARPVKRST